MPTALCLEAEKGINIACLIREKEKAMDGPEDYRVWEKAVSDYVEKEYAKAVRNLVFEHYLTEDGGNVCLYFASMYATCKALSYDPVEGLPDMPEFGVIFKFNADYDRLEWYGNGPEETYEDRKQGAKLGIYRNKVADNMAAYLVPQECGNKTDVRYAKVMDRR